MTSQIAAAAKITRPETGEILLRERLLKRLDDCRHKQVIWIAGPGGAGKTTLVSSFVDTRGPVCLWYRMDGSDNDPAAFFLSLHQAGSLAVRNENLSLPLFTPDYVLSVPEFSRNFFSTLSGSLPSPAMLVFDDFQEISAESPVNLALLECLNHLTEGVQLVIISRTQPPAGFSRLRANRLMEVFVWQDLRLTEEEFKHIIRLRGQAGEKEEILLPLYDRLNGWMAGLSLLLDATRHEGLDLSAPALSTPEELLDYFAGEIFTRLSPRVQDFVLKTAVLPSMTAPMAAALTGLDQAEQFLEDLKRENNFTEKRLASPPVYRYHPLFQEFLSRRAADILPASEIALLRVRAAPLLLEAGRPDDAVSLLVLAEAWPELKELIQNQALTMLMQGRNMSLLGWLRSLPEKEVQGSAWLLYWLGGCQLAYAPAEARPFAEKAYQLFKGQQDQAGIVMSWCAVEISYFFECSDFSSLNYWIKEIFTYVEALPEPLPLDLEAMLSAHIFFALSYCHPQHPQMDYWGERAKELSPLLIDPAYRLLFGSQMVFYYCIWKGDLSTAAHLIRTLGPLAHSKGVSSFGRLMWLGGEMGYALMSGNFQECVDLAAESDEIAQQTGIRLASGTYWGMGAFAHMTLGNYGAAREYLDRMVRSIDPERYFEVGMHRFELALLQALQGELPQAMESARVTLESTLKAGAPGMESFARMAVGQLHIDLGEYEAAAGQLKQARAMGQALKSPAIEFMALLYGAQLAFRTGDESAAYKQLREGLALGREQGYVQALWGRTDVFIDLFLKALEAGIETAYVQDVIRKKNLMPSSPPVAVEDWPWPIRIYTSGRFELVIDGTPVRARGKTQQKPLLMLQALVALGGRKVGDTQVADCLWPDADGDLQSQTLRTTLHRLRRLLGNSEAILMQEHQISLNPACCWIDIWTFERLLGAAEQMRINTNMQRALAFSQKGLALYKGPFLSYLDDVPWTIPLRERLKSKFLREVIQTGKDLEQAGQLETAIDCFDRAISAEPFIEAFYQQLILCYQRLGRDSEARAVYERCRRAFEAGLGIKPSEKTAAIFASLK